MDDALTIYFNGEMNAGLFLAGIGAATGVARGFLINAAVLLAFDLIAERRGAIYVGAIAADTSERV